MRPSRCLPVRNKSGVKLTERKNGGGCGVGESGLCPCDGTGEEAESVVRLISSMALTGLGLSLVMVESDVSRRCGEDLERSSSGVRNLACVFDRSIAAASSGAVNARLTPGRPSGEEGPVRMSSGDVILTDARATLRT